MAATMKLLLSVFFVFLYIDSCKSANLTLGTDVNVKLAYIENVNLIALPFITRNKNCFYTGNTTIKGISAIDFYNTSTPPKVTSGGVGFTFTNIKLRSARGVGLNYQIRIYV
nr:uncharacterized protein LOC113403218 [Vanessa tameamea]